MKEKWNVTFFSNSQMVFFLWEKFKNVISMIKSQKTLINKLKMLLKLKTYHTINKLWIKQNSIQSNEIA